MLIVPKVRIKVNQDGKIRKLYQYGSFRSSIVFISQHLSCKHGSFSVIPCLIGILPDKYLEHLACLADGIFILLGDSINHEMLGRVRCFLHRFYRDFSELYGEFCNTKKSMQIEIMPSGLIQAANSQKKISNKSSSKLEGNQLLFRYFQGMVVVDLMSTMLPHTSLKT